MFSFRHHRYLIIVLLSYMSYVSFGQHYECDWTRYEGKRSMAKSGLFKSYEISGSVDTSKNNLRCLAKVVLDGKPITNDNTGKCIEGCD